MKKFYELTPVELHNDLYIKREDLFRPFENMKVNGGKLRQCLLLVDSIKNNYKGVISCCSIYSPQAPITSAVANYFNKECMICYGATTQDRLESLEMPSMSKKYGADLQIISKSGIHKILYNKAKYIAKEKDYFVVDFGFNLEKYPNILLNAVSIQVENIPNELDNFVITCGSGITTMGVLLGIKKYNKKIKNMYLVCTAPSRKEKIDKLLKENNIQQNIIYIDLFHTKGFKYEKGIEKEFDNIKLHPNYEAKTFDWLEKNIDYHKQKTLLWIVGSKPIEKESE